jgi:hypothetical protein
MHGGPEMRKSGRDPSEETSPALDLRMSHGYKNRIREQLQNPFESFKSPAFFHYTAYSILPSPEASGTEAATRGCRWRPFCVQIFAAN